MRANKFIERNVNIPITNIALGFSKLNYTVVRLKVGHSKLDIVYIKYSLKNPQLR